jgi:hypothetical protein
MILILEVVGRIHKYEFPLFRIYPVQCEYGRERKWIRVGGMEDKIIFY